MKKILIFEYITGGGLIEKKVDNSLLFEAEIIPDGQTLAASAALAWLPTKWRIEVAHIQFHQQNDSPAPLQHPYLYHHGPPL